MNLTDRQQALVAWLAKNTPVSEAVLSPMSGDAGFRQYFRALGENGRSYVVVDAPHDKCNNEGFVAIQQALSVSHIQVPEILAYEAQQGFFCLTDLGEQLLSDVITDENMGEHYRAIIDHLPTIATVDIPSRYELPDFDQAFMQQELSIFKEWMLEGFLELSVLDYDAKQLQDCFDFLITQISEQPKVVMLRDFHSRNIMLTSDHEYAFIDFQDAVHGPITYDVVSLLRDCYLAWPQEKVLSLLAYFVDRMKEQTQMPELESVPMTQWQTWFDLTGLQRHIKVAGIFPRLCLRDGKDGYLEDLPLVLHYIEKVSANYSELAYLHGLVTQTVKPLLEQKLS